MKLIVRSIVWVAVGVGVSQAALRYLEFQYWKQLRR